MKFAQICVVMCTAVMLGLAGPAAAQSDACGSAPLVTAGQYAGTTLGATPDGADTCACPSCIDVWYAYTAPATGLVLIDTCGSPSDTVLSVHSGCPGNTANQIVCNDDTYCAVQALDSAVTLPVVAGATYRIRIAAYASIPGPYVLSIGEVVPATGHDVCAAAQPILPGIHYGTTLMATPDGADNCNGAPRPDMWYAFTAPVNGALHLDTCGSQSDTVMSVHTGCPATLDNMVACNDEAPCGRGSHLDLTMIAGTTYYIRISTFLPAPPGGYRLSVQFDPTPPTCAAAQPVVDAGEFFGVTSGLPADGLAPCDPTPSPDAWYAYTAPATGFVVLDTCQSFLMDTVLSVHSGCPGNASNVLACNDDACGQGSRIALPVTSGQTYFIRVAGFGGSWGAYRLRISPVFTGADDCADATPVSVGTYYGSTAAATPDAVDVCDGESPDSWHVFTSTTWGLLTLNTCGSSFPTALSVHSGCPGTFFNVLGCSESIPCPGPSGTSRAVLTLPITPATAYRIRVGGLNGQAGDYALDVGHIPPPANHECRAAVAIQPGVYTGTTAGASRTGGATCDAGPSPDVWFTFTAATAGRLDLDTCGSAFDTVLSAHTGCPGTPANILACNDDAGGDCGAQSRVSLSVPAGSVTSVRLAGFGHDAYGAYTLNVGFHPCPADWNGDSAVNSADISSFITTWLASLSQGSLAADFNGDGAVNSADISAFITAWLAAISGGC